MNSSARPSRLRRSASSASTCACTDTSSAETGSSATRKSGPVASARAMPMRCRWPPLNSCGIAVRMRADEADLLQQRGDARRGARAARHEAMDRQAVGDLRADAAARVEAANTGPGTRAACAAATARSAAPRRPARSTPSSARGPRSAAAGRAAGGRSCSCPSRSRRPGRPPRRARSAKRHVGHRLHRPAAPEQAALPEAPRQVLGGDQRRVMRPPTSVAAASRQLAPADAARRRARRRLATSGGGAASQARDAEGAARREHAARRQRVRQRHGAGDALGQAAVLARRAAQQGARCRDAAARANTSPAAPLLDDLARHTSPRPGRRSRPPPAGCG